MPEAGSFYSPIVNAQNEEGPWVFLASLVEIQSLLLSPDWVSSSTDLIFEKSRNKYRLWAGKPPRDQPSITPDWNNAEARRRNTEWFFLRCTAGLVSEQSDHSVHLIQLQNPSRTPNIREDKSDVQLQISSVHGWYCAQSEPLCSWGEGRVWTVLSSVAQPRTALRSYTCKMQVWDLNCSLGLLYLCIQDFNQTSCSMPPMPHSSHFKYQNKSVIHISKALWDLCM